MVAYVDFPCFVVYIGLAVFVLCVYRFFTLPWFSVFRHCISIFNMVFPTYSIDFFIFFVGSYLFSLSGAGMDNGLLQGISISFFCLTNIVCIFGLSKKALFVSGIFVTNPFYVFLLVVYLYASFKCVSWHMW